MNARQTLALLAFAPLALHAGETLTIDTSETAGISGLRPFWDLPVVVRADGVAEKSGRGNDGLLAAPRARWRDDYRWHIGLNFWIHEQKKADRKHIVGATVFDACHRNLLVRFPDAAEQIATRLAQGFAIEKAEIVLPFKGTEKIAIGYKEPASFIGKMWDTKKPRWHAVGFALRQPWRADRDVGPTFNASINGARYWTKYGAGDEAQDRFPAQLGPAEVSHAATEGLDVTATLTDAAYGKTLGDRLRRLSDCGYLVRKWETYDADFITPGYEWAIMTGSRGIFTGDPRLVVTLKEGAAEVGSVPPPADIDALAGKTAGEPTLRMPTDEQFEALKAKYSFQRPDWMPDWQWKRVQELYGAGGRANIFPPTMEEYEKWLDGILATQPRKWEGFNAADQLMLFYDFAEALPAYIQDYWRLYWETHLMPHRNYWELTHNQYHQIWTKYRGFGSDYYDRTGDWRGGKSFYREGYCRFMSTMNFNHTAAIGCLLGGRFIGSARAIDDGRNGLEMFPLRLWAWDDGTTQESIDHYYMSHTLTAQKAFMDYGPTHFDRLMGRSILLKSIEELAVCYHPNLRRFISTGGRTTPFYATHIQEGVNHIVHSLSKQGALVDLDKAALRLEEKRKQVLNRVPVIGHDLPPRRVAMQALKSPWGPDWLGEIIDHKPIPFEMTATWKQWGAFRLQPKYKKSYIGRHYGVASLDFVSGSTLPNQSLWSRKPGTLRTADDLGQLLVRFGYNRSNFIDTHQGGTLGMMGGSLGVLQHKGKMVIASSPHDKLKSSHYNPAKEKDGVRSVQTSICLFDLRSEPTWTIFVDGKPVTELPLACTSASRITIEDGVAFIGIIPLASTDLGRDAEIVLKAGGDPVVSQTRGHMTEGLVIDNYFYKREAPIDVNDPRLDKAVGGFVIEVSDVTEHESFAAFQKHISAARLDQSTEDGGDTMAVAYASGGDSMELSFRPVGADNSNNDVKAADVMPVRRVNGKWPYLPEGIDRETPLSVQGRAMPLVKNGARLMLEKEQMGYVITEPRSGTYMMANPLPDASHFTFETPEGVTLEADGKIGLAIFEVNPGKGSLVLHYGVRPGSDPAGMATCLVVKGMAKRPAVTLNGAVATDAVATAQLDGGKAYVVPLVGNAKPGAVDQAAIDRVRTAAQSAFGADKALATLDYESGEHYILTKPAAGVWRFQRQWPSGVAFRATTPEGITVTADGRLAVISIQVDTAANRVEVYAPAYLYDSDTGQAFEEKAKALLISAASKPSVWLNGRERGDDAVEVELDGKTYYAVPMYDFSRDEATDGLNARFATAMERIVNK